MYLPRLFQEQDLQRLFAFMRRHSFATLVTVEDGVPFATHLPFLVEPSPEGTQGRLIAHMARANPQWRGFSEERDVDRRAVMERLERSDDPEQRTVGALMRERDV